MLDYLGLGCGALVLLVIVGIALAVRSHRRWLDRQSPAGVWQGKGADGAEILLAFDGGPREGVYRELRTRDEARMREIGHWSVAGGELHLLIMATDVTRHLRFGEDSVYRISYTGPDEILLDGPDRPSLELTKAPEGTEVPIEPWQAEESARP